MSLDWNIEKVKDWRALHEDEVEATITDAVIFMTMPVGLSSIREDRPGSERTWEVTMIQRQTLVVLVTGARSASEAVRLAHDNPGAYPEGPGSGEIRGFEVSEATACEVEGVVR